MTDTKIIDEAKRALAIAKKLTAENAELMRSIRLDTASILDDVLECIENGDTDIAVEMLEVFAAGLRKQCMLRVVN